MSEEQRRLTYLRENVEHLAEEKNTLESLIWNLRNSADTEAAEILRRLRNGTDPVTLNQHIQAGRSLAQVRRDIPSDSSVGCTSPLVMMRLGRVLNESIDPPNLLSPSMQASQYEAVVNAIVTSTPPDVDEIVRKLRHHENLDSILNSVRAGPFLQPLAERDVDMHAGIEGDYSSREHVFGLTQFGSRNLAPVDVQLARAPEAHTPLSQTNHPWTSVTDDQEFIDHLISIYFTWQHCFFQSFPEKLFREDMAAGRTRYCSKILVNAVCAAGCLLSPRPEARRDPNDASTADIGFFDEAIRLLKETQVSSIPTVAALFLLCHVESYRGHLGLVWNFCGQSGRMALDLSLHLRSDKAPGDDLSSETRMEEHARVHAFWGCFIADQ